MTSTVLCGGLSSLGITKTYMVCRQSCRAMRMPTEAWTPMIFLGVSLRSLAARRP